MADCGCAGPSNSPPGTTPGSVNAPLGAATSFGGTAVVPRGTCGPAKCPQPPTSDAEERQPYCPSWVEKLTATFMGKLIIAVEGCLYKLKSKCSGYIFFDGDSEQVSVVNPPFVSSRPKETAYGFLAKTVPTLTTVCVDEQDECLQEIRQEVASQIMGDASCGEIVVANFPLCGELPASEAADADKQVRFDYMQTQDQEEAGCPSEIRFLAYVNAKRGTGKNAVDCKQWISVRRLKMLGSQWGFVSKDDTATVAKAKTVVLVPVEGGDPDDPCYEMRVLEAGSGGLPEGAVECDTLIRRKVGTADEGWYPVQLGGRAFYLDTAQVLALGTNTNLSDYQDFKDMGCKLRAIVSVSAFVSLSGSGVGGSGVLTVNGVAAAVGYTPSAGGFFLHNPRVIVPLTANSLALSVTYSVVGSPVLSSQSYRLLGYEVG